MSEPRHGDARYVVAGGLEFAYLDDGPADGPLMFCLHRHLGRPDDIHVRILGFVTT